MLLRPHHALCARFFAGKGYSAAFVAHMAAVLRELGREGASVTLADDCDAVCACCPHNADGVCASGAKVRAINRRAAGAMGLAPGDTLPWSRLSALAEERRAE